MKAQNKALAEQKFILELLKLRVIQENVRRTPQSLFERAISARNQIYQQVRFKNTPPNFDFMSLAKAYQSSMNNPKIGHICGGHAILYLAALESLGIPARFVGIYNSNKEPFQSHATVEFYVNGKWYASDPSYNVMYQHNGNYLSYKEIYRLLQNGIQPIITSNNFPLKETQKIETTGMVEKAFYRYLVIHPGSQDCTENAKPKFIPETWDGSIIGQNNTITHVDYWSGVYLMLSKGFLH